MPAIRLPSNPVICTDVDNTLCKGQLFHPSTAKAVDHLKNQGIQVIPVTGRGPELAASVLEPLGLSVYPGGYHHGAITYGTNGEVLIDKRVPEEAFKITAEAIDAFMHDSEYAPQFRDIVLMGQGLNKRVLFGDSMKLGMNLLLSLGSCQSQIVHSPSYKEFDLKTFAMYQCSLMVFKLDGSPRCDRAILDLKRRIKESLKENELSDLRVMVSTDGIIDVIRDDVDKANAVEAIGKQMKFQMENVIALGDAENDKHMLRAADYSIAMIDGLESVKEVAKAVSPKSTLNGGWAGALSEAGLFGEEVIQ